MTLEDDLRADGEPEKEFHPGVAQRMPRKRTAGGALLRNSRGEVLFVVPIYKPTLDIPGGVTDVDESPRTACQREIREELGIDLPLGRLLVVDWLPPQGVWGDGLMFIFDGGVISEDIEATAALPADELSGVRFLPLDKAADQMRPSFVRRLRHALEAVEDGSTRYLDFGRTPEERASA
ncbi:NUDIX domain-containing protein [Yinghuangia sp. YIM S09857]|uniref:NUDIX domain-containing protein n=1 Tax=Yinghuangia sp. YIM S09857 TaxID=3436929 RepID=UPI003F538AFB